MLSLTKVALVSVLFSLAKADDPFWVVQHGPLVSTRLDPIVSPGAVSGHEHSIIGASAFGPYYDYATNELSTCVTGNVDIDKSNYWMPQLYRKQSGGGFKKVQFKGANTYYFVRRNGQEPVYEFPPGFRMLAGNASRNTFNASDPAQMAIRYACLGVSGPETNAFPTQQCPGDLRAEAFFPHCWDGVNNWLEGNAHVAYSSEGNFDGGGKCPDSHPKRIMSVFYEFFFDDSEAYEEGARVWATGDDLGYSLHADFVNGWPEGKFTEILSYGSTCAVEFSLEKCPALKPHMKDQGGCTYPGMVVAEDDGSTDVISKLPGNNPIWGRSGPKTTDSSYQETATFTLSTGGAVAQPTGPGKQYAQVKAGDIHIATVGGDPAYTGATSTAQQEVTITASGDTGVTQTTATTSSNPAVTSSNGMGSSGSLTTTKTSTATVTASASASGSKISGQELIASGTVPSASLTSSGTSSGHTCKSKSKRSRSRQLL